MKRTIILGTLLAAGFLSGAASAQTLAEVKARGALNCGIATAVRGFAAIDANDEWQGFDVAICRAVAAAVLGDPMAVNFEAANGPDLFDTLAAGDLDMLVRDTPWTFSRDVGQKFTFAGISYFDGQAFMVNRDLGVSSATELAGLKICVQRGATAERTLEEYFRKNNINYERVPIETIAEAQEEYLSRACDGYTTNASVLAATRATFAAPDDHAILPEIISKEPLGPLVRQGDDDWADIVRWTVNALVAAEEYGVTSANIEELARGTKTPEINRLLGTEGDLGAMLGLDAYWAVRAISAGGNYGEIFASNIGEQTPIGLARGLNAQYSQGGLIYAPPFR